MLDYEQISSDMQADKKKLETMLATVKSNSERQIVEIKNENEQLIRTVETLRKRSKINAEGKAKDIEKENKVFCLLICRIEFTDINHSGERLF